MRAKNIASGTVLAAMWSGAGFVRGWETIRFRYVPDGRLQYATQMSGAQPPEWRDMSEGRITAASGMC